MNKISRRLIGLASLTFGLFLTGIMFFDTKENGLEFLIYGGFFIIIGILIFFNKKEDIIEEIKK